MKIYKIRVTHNSLSLGLGKINNLMLCCVDKYNNQIEVDRDKPGNLVYGLWTLD